MAVTLNTSYPPLTTTNRIESIVNKPEPKLDSQELETVQVQKTRDHPTEEFKFAINEAPKIPKSFASEEVKNFLSKKLVAWTTFGSVAFNIISIPFHLLKDSPLKKIINRLSMLSTQIYQATFSVAGLISAFGQNNPFLLFSFLMEGAASFLGLRNIYLFRGIGTGIDGAATGIKDKYKKSEFSSYGECFNHNWQAVKDTCKDFATKFAKDPTHIFRLEGCDIAIFASLLAATGGLIGMTINERIGGAMRDIFGGFGDVGIFKLDHSLAKSCGFFALSGTILDFSARVFIKGATTLLGIQDTAPFERLRDAFHEGAIAFDRLGQLFFLKYNQETDESLKNKTREDHSGYFRAVGSAMAKNKQLATPA